MTFHEIHFIGSASFVFDDSQGIISDYDNHGKRKL